MNNDFERALNEKNEVFNPNLIFIIFVSKVNIGVLILRERAPLFPCSLNFHVFRLC